MINIRKKITFLIILVFFTGCSTKNELPTKSEFQEQIAPQKFENTINTYGQTLDIPPHLLNNLFQWVGYTGIYPSPNENQYFPVKENNNICTIQGTKRPTYELKLLKPYKIMKIKYEIKENNETEPSSIEDIPKVALDYLLFKPLNAVFDSLKIKYYQTPNEIIVAIKGEKEGNLFSIKDNEITKEKPYFIDNPLDDAYASSVIVQISSFNAMCYKKSHLSFTPDNVSFLIADKEVEEKVILENLKTRKNENDNEELLKEIAIKNKDLFRIIQQNSKSLYLKEDSFAFLPIDVSIEYAFKNYATIVKTGRYKAENGDYKKFKTNDTFIKNDTVITYKPSTRVQINGSNVEIRKVPKKRVQAKYIDFSGGI